MIYIRVRSRLSQRRPRGDPSAARDRRPRLRGRHHDADAVRRARRLAAAALYRDASPTALGAIMSAAALSGSALYALSLRRKVEE